MENNNEDRRLPDETVKRLAEVVYTGLRKSAAELGVTNSWINEVDARLLEPHKEYGRISTFGLFSDILKEAQKKGVDVVERIGVLDVHSRELKHFLWRHNKAGQIALDSMEVESKQYMVRIVPATALKPDAVEIYSKVFLRDPLDTAAS